MSINGDCSCWRGCNSYQVVTSDQCRGWGWCCGQEMVDGDFAQRRENGNEQQHDHQKQGNSKGETRFATWWFIVFGRLFMIDGVIGITHVVVPDYCRG